MTVVCPSTTGNMDFARSSCGRTSGGIKRDVYGERPPRENVGHEGLMAGVPSPGKAL